MRMLIIYPLLPFLCLALPKLDKETDKSMNPYIKWGGIILGTGAVGATVVKLAVKATSAPTSLERKETNNPENIGEPAIYIDKRKQSYTTNTPYTPNTPSYGSEKATNAAEKNYTADESSTKERNTEEDELETDNEIETEITAETNVAEGNISPGTNISVATSSQLGQSSDISIAAVKSDKDVQYPTIATLAVKATSAPTSLERKETNNPENIGVPAKYIDKNEHFQKLLEKVRDRPKKAASDVHGIDIEWEDIQDYTDEQIELLRQGALPRPNVKDLFTIDFKIATHKDAYGARIYEIPEFNEEAAYPIMKALMFAGSSLAFTSYNAEILKPMARAQRENTRDLEGVKFHSLVRRLTCGAIPVTRDVVLPDSWMYSLHTVPLTPGNPVIEWSVLNMDSQGELCVNSATLRDSWTDRKFFLHILEEGRDVRDPDIDYSLVKYPHPTERDQSVLKIQDSTITRGPAEELLGQCIATTFDDGRSTHFECPEAKV